MVGMARFYEAMGEKIEWSIRGHNYDKRQMGMAVYKEKDRDGRNVNGELRRKGKQKIMHSGRYGRR
jgi:hypothetical protein